MFHQSEQYKNTHFYFNYIYLSLSIHPNPIFCKQTECLLLTFYEQKLHSPACTVSELVLFLLLSTVGQCIIGTPISIWELEEKFQEIFIRPVILQSHSFSRHRSWNGCRKKHSWGQNWCFTLATQESRSWFPGFCESCVSDLRST